MNQEVSVQASRQGSARRPQSPAVDEGERARVCTAIRAALLAARNSDGGWPYVPGRRSRIEPTCWALLALARAAEREVQADVLHRWRKQDGWLVDVPRVPPNHAFNALAALIVEQSPASRPLADAIATQVIAAKGVQVRQGSEMRQDNSLQAWSWIDGTFSWVEPTAWCLILLKQRRARGADAGTAAQERIAVGERMLLDRVCREGGWNYGNSNVYGQDLWPYVPTTAVALLAMQDRRDAPAVQRSLRLLADKSRSELSMAALAISAICLRVLQEDSSEVEQDLVAHASQAVQDDRSDANRVGLAMALYALAVSTRPMELLELAG